MVIQQQLFKAKIDKWVRVNPISEIVIGWESPQASVCWSTRFVYKMFCISLDLSYIMVPSTIQKTKDRTTWTPQKTRCTQVQRKGNQFMLHKRHPHSHSSRWTMMASYYSTYKLRGRHTYNKSYNTKRTQRDH